MNNEHESFDAIKDRLDEIANEVAEEGISLDDALALYEEAVRLGLRACDVSEEDILIEEEATQPEGGDAAVAADAAVGSDGTVTIADEVAEISDDAGNVIISETITEEPAETERSAESF